MKGTTMFEISTASNLVQTNKSARFFRSLATKT